MLRPPKIVKGVVVMLMMAMPFACSKVGKKVTLFDKASIPAGIAENFKLVYTDSTRLKAILESSIYKDFSNQPSKYDLFPKGLKVTFFDKQKNETVITANYGIVYKDTGLIELKNNVHIQTFDGKSLKTNQLFWNQNMDWIFTDVAFVYTNTADGTVMNGVGMDFNTSFQEVIAHKTIGVVYLENTN